MPESRPAVGWPDLKQAPCVLVVDDEPTFCVVMGDILHAFGCDVVFAHSAGEALRILETLVPDLVLTDVMMPDVDGLTLLRRLRAEPAWSHLPTIVVSAKAMQEDAIAARSAGADGWLPKPFAIKDLRAAILPFVSFLSSESPLP
ncbi:MAG: response regulator [Anaerolineales bacterium]